MTPLTDWPAAPVLETEDLILEPLRIEHAAEMAPLLDDAGLHTFIGGQPATLEQLTAQYRHQCVGMSEDGTELWFNWVLRCRDTNGAAGYVQATVGVDTGVVVAEVAWVVSGAHQGRGLARQSTIAMAQWLTSAGVGRIIAHVHPGHAASKAVARAAGLHATATIVDGEVLWVAGA